jgi:hypothetical protein
MVLQRYTARPASIITERIHLGLCWSAAICASISLVALVAHVFGVLPMVYFLTFFGVPSVLLLFALAAFAKWINAQIFINDLVVGVIAGLIATLVYDAVRFVLNRTVFTQYDSFKAIYIFGSWISGKEVTTPQAAIAGWTYHFWNGLSIALFYVLTFGRRHWIYAVGWALVMEACMLGLFPFFLQVTDKIDFIALSMIGHLAYGLVLGFIAQKYALNWEDAV